MAAKFLLLGGTSIALAVIASPVQAQEIQDSSSAPDNGDIVVTAQRRGASAQRTPISVSVVSEAALTASGVIGSAQIGQTAPSTNLAKLGVAVVPAIRGIATNSSNVGDEPNVAIYVDGVYQPSALSNNFALAGIKQIEILKGPQGTLFGRNAEGGAILLTTRTPSYSESEQEGSISYGERDSVEAKAYVSVPLADRAGLGISALYQRSDGYIRDVFRNKTIGKVKDFVIRPKLVADLNDRLTFTGLFQYSHTDDPTGQLYAPVINGSQPNYVGLPAGASLPVPTKPRQVALSYTPFNRIDSYNGSVKFAYEGEAVTLSSQTSMTSNQSESLFDGDQGPLLLSRAFTRTHERTYQQEFLLSSKGESRVSWVAGLFLYDYKASYDPLAAGSSADGVTPLRTTQIFSTGRSRSIAPFGEANISLTDRLKFTVGARYTFERRYIDGSIISPAGAQIASVDAEKLFKSFTPRAILSYQMPDLVNLYASYSRGFKSGTFNTSGPTQAAVNPETLDAYEIGAKTLLPGPWRASVALFYQDYKGIQLSAFNSQLFTITLFNAAIGRSYGAEAEVHGRLTENLSFDGFVGYTNAKYTNFPTASANFPDTDGIGLRNLIVDVSGRPFIRIPSVTAGATLTYNHELGAGDFRASANVYYRSQIFWDLSYRNRAAPYAIANGDVSWSPDGSRLSFGIFARNLFNKDYQTGGNSTPQTYYAVWAEPRTVGARISLALQ